MQQASARFTKNDLAKYPFLKETTEYVKNLDFKIEDVTSPTFADMLKRAQERIENAIVNTLTGKRHKKDEIEILSFPISIMLITATQNPFIKKRYALAEAKQAYEEMQQETTEKLLAIARNFGWNIKRNDNPSIANEFILNFADYLRNTTHLREDNWKLINRPLSKGNVYLTKKETARLLSEEIRRHIEKRLENKDLPTLPTAITEIAEKIKKLTKEKIGESEMEGFPKVIIQTAFPPCVNELYQAFNSGRHLSHIGRFTLTSFLVSIGMPSEKVIELFKNVSDFNERMTRYQVEHIAGEKGSRTHYIPPKCDTLRTHGVCINPDETCRRTRHPLGYYRRKLRTVKTKA